MTSNNQAAFNEQSFISEEPIYALNSEQASRALQELLARTSALEEQVLNLQVQLANPGGASS